MTKTDYNKQYRKIGESAFLDGTRLRALQKRCSICKTVKHAQAFYLSNSNPDGLHGWCKECSDVRTTENARKRMGISPAEYAELFLKQGGKCAICLTDDPGKRDFCLDHDHVTGRVRGILCTPCNTLLGQARDSMVILQAALDYLGGEK